MSASTDRTSEERRRLRDLGALRWIYLVTATIVLCHEIDSAHWAEWDLFHLPGGAALFVALHFPLIPLVLLGQSQLATGRPTARWTALLLGGACALGGLLHTAFLLSGDPRFSTPLSIALIGALGLSGALLVVSAVRSWRELSFARGRSSGHDVEALRTAIIADGPGRPSMR